MAKQRTGLPTRQQILDFIAASDQPAGKREIARAFGLSGQDKVALKALLRDMADEGLIDASPGRAFHQAGGVPKVTVLRVTDVDDSGTAWAVPERWDAKGPEPRLRLIERGKGAVGVGDRVLARTEEKGNGFVAHPMKKLLKGSELVLGVVHEGEGGLWLRPVDKKERRELPISDVGKAAVGDLVLAEKTGRGRTRIPDFVKLADALGCVGLRCETKDDVDATIDKAMAINDQPVVIDFTVGKDAMVWPMVAAGASNDDIQAARDIRPTWEGDE